jgi:Gram-negative bacterial TonB protein C-terminal
MKSGWLTAVTLAVLGPSMVYAQAAPPAGAPAAPSGAADGKTAAPAGAAPGEAATADTAAPAAQAGEITEAELKTRLTGRPLFLRGLYLDETLHFNMYGDLDGQSPKGSFTLCGVFIDHVRLTKKTLELEGVRFGVHFEGEAPWEQQSTSFDRIQITPKKKHQLIVIDRQLVVIPKKKKAGKDEKPAAAGTSAAAAAPGTAAGAAPAPASSEGAETAAAAASSSDPASQSQGAGAPGQNAGVMVNGKELPPGATTSPAESADHLRKAIDKIFAPNLDGKMVAEMPAYWQYFYQAQESHKWLEPTDQTLVHPGPGVEGPKLVKNVVPESNDFAQKGEVAGVASYKVILDPQGKILAVAVYRPIGFGLDENAVAAIEKSTFVGAVKDGKPVPSVIDVAVNFRIYSKRTAAGSPDTVGDPNESPVTGKPALPGLYSAQGQASTQAQSPPHQ